MQKPLEQKAEDISYQKMIDATEALLRICRIWSISFNKCSVSICYGFVNYCICVISSLWCCYFFFISFLPVFLIELPLIIIRIQGIWLNCGFRAPWESFQFHISSLFSLQLLSERKSLALVLSLSSCLNRRDGIFWTSFCWRARNRQGEAWPIFRRRGPIFCWNVSYVFHSQKYELLLGGLRSLIERGNSWARIEDLLSCSN